MDEDQKDYRLAAIMFTDIHEFSRLMEIDEPGTLEMLDFHNRLVFDLAKQYGGTVIKTMGDALLLEFNNTMGAVKCGLEIQNRLHDYNAENTPEKRFMLRIGIHLGDIWFFDNDALGEGVNIASRLKSISKPGRVCISKDIYNQIHNKINLDIINLGRVKLKNIDKEILAYEILTRFAEREGSHAEALRYTRVRPRSERINDSIVDQIKIEGRRMPLKEIEEFFPGAAAKVHSILSRLEQRGILTRIDGADGQIEYGLGDFNMSHPARNWEKKVEYRMEKALERAARRGEWRKHRHASWKRRSEDDIEEEKSEKGADQLKQDATDLEIARSVALPAHLAAFLSVNGMLFLIYLLATPGVHPWFLYPAGAWGIGIVNHFVYTVIEKRHSREKRCRMTDGQKKLLKKLHETERGWSNHLASYLSVIGFLFMIYFITTGIAGFMWPAIVAAAWGIGLISHGMSHIVKKALLIKKLKKLGLRRPRDLSKRSVEEPAGDMGQSGLVAEAFRIKESLLEQIKSSGQHKGEWGSDLEPLMDNFMQQIRELNSRQQELSRTMDHIHSEDFGQELSALHEKRDRATSEHLKEEYDKSIQQVEKQRDSFQDLRNQREILDLRLKSAVMSLKRLQIDFARMKGISSSDEHFALSSIKSKSEELSRYLEDLKSGYSDLDDNSYKTSH